MKKLFILLVLLTSGCQVADHQTDSSKSPVGKKISQRQKDKAIYNRYNNKGNRYTIKQDAAPKKNAKVNFKEPVPVKESFSRYGNPTEYSVDGRKYKVMSSSSGYKSRGIASWYGTKFHKQRTSSGEPYNMYVLSAAHKTLPLPTYVRVRNLNNGREAIVRVNDRGPFHGDRIIDLSYAAAVKLGIFPQGTAPVEIETLHGTENKAHYYLQAGAFSSQALAKELKTKLMRFTKSPITIESYKKHYVVRIGPFNAKQMADTLQTKLAANGVKGAFSVLI